MDVVPAGDLEDWQTPPFEATLKDGWLIGRGVQDDKGPSLAALYAVKSLLDQGVVFTKRIRFIFGTDEETLWRCMNRYNQIEEKADLGFAPDSSFPLTYAEKGLLQVKLHGPGWEDRPLQAGRALNVVPDKATYKGDRLEELLPVIEQSGVKYSEEAGAVTVLGLSKHPKDSAEGVNAIVGLAESLSLISLIQPFSLSQMPLGKMRQEQLSLMKSKMNQVVLFPSILQPSPLMNSNLKSGLIFGSLS